VAGVPWERVLLVPRGIWAGWREPCRLGVGRAWIAPAAGAHGPRMWCFGQGERFAPLTWVVVGPGRRG